MSKVGCPIRKSTDQRLFAPSRSLSQRTTSFIASYRQGIHQMPLSHLIALISNAHLALAGTDRSEKIGSPGQRTRHDGALLPEVIEINPYGAAVRLLRPLQATTVSRRLRSIPSLRCQDHRARPPFSGPLSRGMSDADACFFLHGCSTPPRSGGARRVGLEAAREESGGARRDRTADILLAKQALSQLSYGP